MEELLAEELDQDSGAEAPRNPSVSSQSGLFHKTCRQSLYVPREPSSLACNRSRAAPFAQSVHLDPPAETVLVAWPQKP